MSPATGDGDATGADAAVGCAVAATVRVGICDAMTGDGVPVALGAVLPAAGCDSVGEGAAMPALGDVSPPGPDGAPHAARRTTPTSVRATARATELTR